MKKERNNKGITLIALIITIIVMLILVGVSVNVALNGGLFDTAKTAVSETQKAADEEVLLSAKISLLYGDDKDITKQGLQENLPEAWEVVEGYKGFESIPAEMLEQKVFTVTSKNGNGFTVYENGDMIEETISGCGFFFNKEYVCENYFSDDYVNTVSMMLLEDERIKVSCFAEAGLEAGDAMDFTDMFGNVVLRETSIELNKEYFVESPNGSKGTYLVNEEGNLIANWVYSAEDTTFVYYPDGAGFIIGDYGFSWIYKKFTPREIELDFEITSSTHFERVFTLKI